MNGGSNVSGWKLDEFTNLEPPEIGRFGRVLLEEAVAIPGDQIKALKDIEIAITGLHRISVSIRKASNRNSLTQIPELFDEDEGYDILDTPKREEAVRFQTSAAFRRYTEQVMKRRWVASNPVDIQKWLEEFEYLNIDERKKWLKEYKRSNSGENRKWPKEYMWLREYRDTLLSRCKEIIATRRRELVYLRSHQVGLQKRYNTQPASRLQQAPQRQPIPLIHHSELPLPPNFKDWEIEKACPYCCLVLPRAIYDQQRRNEAWTHHLIEDMQPYICLFRHCNAEGKTYSTFTEWQMHLMRPHFEGWICPLQHENEGNDASTKIMYENEADCKLHLNFEHPELDNEDVRNALRSAGRLANLPRKCFVCFQEFPKITDMQEHVASHLQAMFVLALPWREDTELETAISSNGSVRSGHANDDLEVENLFQDEETPKSLYEQYGFGIKINAERVAKLGAKETSESLTPWISQLEDYEPEMAMSDIESNSSEDFDSDSEIDDPSQNKENPELGLLASGSIGLGGKTSKGPSAELSMAEIPGSFIYRSSRLPEISTVIRPKASSTIEQGLQQIYPQLETNEFNDTTVEYVSCPIGYSISLLMCS